MQRAVVLSRKHNRASLAHSNPVGVSYTAPSLSTTLQSDYNLFWVPNGYVGQLTNLSSQGFLLPSMQRQRTLNQWRSATGLDMNSVEGNIVPEFVSVAPGAEDLHIRPETVGSLANNRGVAISGLGNDIDRDARGAVLNRPYDIAPTSSPVWCAQRPDGRDDHRPIGLSCAIGPYAIAST